MRVCCRLVRCCVTVATHIRSVHTSLSTKGRWCIGDCACVASCRRSVRKSTRARTETRTNTQSSVVLNTGKVETYLLVTYFEVKVQLFFFCRIHLLPCLPVLVTRVGVISLISACLFWRVVALPPSKLTQHTIPTTLKQSGGQV